MARVNISVPDEVSRRVDRAKVSVIRTRSEWPPVVPTVVLAEVLTGDHRRDVHANRLLRLCILLPVDESLARMAAAMRTVTGRAGEVSAVDAVVAAVAARSGGATVLTSDPSDLADLLGAHRGRIRVERV
jgi:predicted nucleic acid-binding protein